MTISTLLKAPSAAADVALRFAQTGAVAIAIERADGVGGPSHVAASYMADAHGAVDVSVSGGQDNERCRIAVTVTPAAGSPSTQDFDVLVLDPAWSMPDGSPIWLDLIEFIDRFGVDETIVATAAAADGPIDRRLLTAALADAQAEACADVAARYALPLATVPPLLKSLVFDLAVPRLYKRGPPPWIEEAAKVARRKLERIGKGDLPLPLPAGGAAEPVASDAPVVFESGGRAYADNLFGY